MIVNLRYWFVGVVCCAHGYVWDRGAGCYADVGLCGEYRDVSGLCCRRSVRELGAAVCLCGCRPLRLAAWRVE